MGRLHKNREFLEPAFGRRIASIALQLADANTFFISALRLAAERLEKKNRRDAYVLALGCMHRLHGLVSQE